EVALIIPDQDNPGKYMRVGDYKNMPASFTLEAGQQYYLLFGDNWNDADSLSPFKVRMTLE
ncbi:MAG: hypothetical protein JW760_14395, partial [Spirochaetales bacterium]|nr:hypothetical protein [Spirochaetales bacterium]